MPNEKKINTKVLPGFLELLPAEQLLFERMKAIIADTYESFGFIPLDTPAIERAEVLLAKAGGETEKQIYRFSKGENDLALRFDLTVPLARYVSEHLNDLSFPFRRYHIAKVYRGERSQKGRYREFYQCDIDIIGRGRLGLVNDAEVLAVAYETFNNLGLPPFAISISNRQLLSGFLENLGLSSLAVDVLRIVDKVEKVSPEATKEALLDLGLEEKQARALIGFISLRGAGSEVLGKLKGLGVENKTFARGVAELEEVLCYVAAFGLPAAAYQVDLSIARGLDYYTGTVYETKLLDHPEIGSICSGGRYDNLAENYTSQALPGVGLSIGLTRLFSQLLDLGIVKAGAASPAQVIIIPFAEAMNDRALTLARTLRLAKIKNETLLEEGKIKEKLSLAAKRGARFVVIIGEDELAGDFLTLKDMESGVQRSVSEKELIVALS